MFPRWMAWPITVILYACLPRKLREQLVERGRRQLEADDEERSAIARWTRKED